LPGRKLLEKKGKGPSLFFFSRVVSNREKMKKVKVKKKTKEKVRVEFETQNVKIVKVRKSRVKIVKVRKSQVKIEFFLVNYSRWVHCLIHR
jgi:hypothetical protein